MIVWWSFYPPNFLHYELEISLNKRFMNPLFLREIVAQQTISPQAS
jgi:hypothetical protein